jgi:anti-sigma factor RsiW
VNGEVPAVQDIACKDFVELVTAYLDDALPEEVRAQVDAHLARCDGCSNVLDQWRTVIDLAGRLTDVDVDTADPLTRDRLMSTFRDLRRR